jgi:preprotein translocase subunit SecE
MPLKLYKPGQGYWTRLLSGVGGGVLIVAGAVWIVEQLEVIQGDWRLILQGAVLVAVVGGLGLLIYRAVAVSPRTGEFLIATEGEMKKVNWPVRREVKGSTWVVIWTVILMTILLYVADLIFSAVLQWIGVVETF